MRLLPALAFLTTALAAHAAPVPTLIVDGANNHDWRATTDALRATLDATGRFEVNVSTAPQSRLPKAPRRPNNSNDPTLLDLHSKLADAHRAITSPLKNSQPSLATWNPDFASHQAIVLNYNGHTWSEQTRNAFVDYVRAGGGVVLVHGANNAFANWSEFNQMIGLGWRPALIGKAVVIDPDTGQPISPPNTALKNNGASGHGSKHAFAVTNRTPDHPVLRGLPTLWWHAKDELYHNMRGPAENLTVLASAYSDPKTNGSGQHEPVVWETRFGAGRVVTISLGHFWPQQDWWDSLYCVGFQTVFARAVEYAATGTVTLPVPPEFPSPTEPSVLTPSALTWPHPDKPTDTVRQAAQQKKSENPYTLLTPDEALATFELAGGYEIDLLAAEPDVQEPVLTVWDGNGAMYVAEMRSYMQDVEGNGTKTLRNGRIKRLEDTTGDGHYDHVTTFVDNLNLPRAILPLDDRIAVRETDSTRVTAYRDTDGDGVADQSDVLFEGKPIDASRSVEHQDSGLVWNLDNHIYITYNSERYRFTDGSWKAEKQPGHWTQWGLDRDNHGTLYWMSNSTPLQSVYLHPRYWNIIRDLGHPVPSGVPVDLGDPYSPEFMAADSTCLLNDRGGSASASRAFTSACGQSVFRGHKLPFADRSRYFFVDPTIHVLRRADITDNRGLPFLEKTDPAGTEFLRTADINSRFVNTADAPDGTLVVTDMARGIIQDAPWLSPGPRKAIVQNGLDKHIQNGRLWRVRHKDHHPDYADQPRMLDESTVELVRHLCHPNGWWRDTAQRLIILREDRQSVTPLLEAMALFDQNPLARLHALWTLEGTGEISDPVLGHAFRDRDPHVRAAAVLIVEPRVSQSSQILARLAALADDRSPVVAKQLILTLAQLHERKKPHPRAVELIQQAARKHVADRGVMLATTVALWKMDDLPLAQAVADDSLFKSAPSAVRSTVASDWKAALANWKRGLTYPDDMPDTQRRYIRGGETLYFKTCVSCHGPDLEGVAVPGTDLALAPPLVGSPRVTGPAEHLVPILTNGLVGPLDGKAYAAGYMAPAATLGVVRDDRLAEILSYLRFRNDPTLPLIDKEQVKAIRRQHESRTTPWTQPELEALPK